MLATREELRRPGKRGVWLSVRTSPYSCAAGHVYSFCLWGKATHARPLLARGRGRSGHARVSLAPNSAFPNQRATRLIITRYLRWPEPLMADHHDIFRCSCAGRHVSKWRDQVSAFACLLIGRPPALPLDGHRTGLRDTASISPLHLPQRHREHCPHLQCSTCTYSLNWCR